MSEIQRAEEWVLASDGKWYPPECRPHLLDKGHVPDAAPTVGALVSEPIPPSPPPPPPPPPPVATFAPTLEPAYGDAPAYAALIAPVSPPPPSTPLAATAALQRRLDSRAQTEPHRKRESARAPDPEYAPAHAASHRKRESAWAPDPYAPTHAAPRRKGESAWAPDPYAPAHAAPRSTPMAPALVLDPYAAAHAGALTIPMAPALAPELEYLPAPATPQPVSTTAPTTQDPPAAAPPRLPAPNSAPTPAHASKSTRSRYMWGFIVPALLAVGAVAWVAVKPGSTGRSPGVTTAPATIGGKTTIGDGTWRVGTKAKMVAPGNYETTGGVGCYWERDQNLTGTESAILASDDLSGPGVVTILPTDKEFKTENCGTWSPLPVTGTQSTSFGDGAYAVGIAIAAGTYTTSGGAECYWEQDKDYTGDKSSIISNRNTSGPLTLTIPAFTKEFKTQGCGTWHIS
jgi:hypothetical protein